MSSQELLNIQHRLKKIIVDHQSTLLKLQKEPQNQELKKLLHDYQNRIKALSEEQKRAVQSYREQIGRKDGHREKLADDRLREKKLDNGVVDCEENGLSVANGDNNENSNDHNRSDEHNKCANKALAGECRSRMALNIPQVSTAPKMNAQTIKMPALAIKSLTGQTHFLVPVSTSANKKQLIVVPKKNVYNYLKPIVRMPITSSSSSLASSTSTTATTTTAQQVHPTSILVRTSPTKSPTKVPLVKSLNTIKSTPKLSDKQSKDHFMMALGLVTKEALSELQSRKCERKRRTTANPQFSSAALEAKRISKMEIAERKAKRRLLITSNGETCTANSNSNTTASNTNSNNKAKPTYISNGKSTKSIGIEPQEISPGVHIVTSIGNLPANCCVCDEQCECDIDFILFCKHCRTLFHATCSASKDDFSKDAKIPCPKCEKLKRQIEETIKRKREEKEKLLSRKKDLDEQLTQMREALDALKDKLKEKELEKNSLNANQEVIQQKVNKFIETLKLVEDTGQLEDRFASSLEATAHIKGESTANESANICGMEDEDLQAMDAETEKATAQLEKLVKAEEESHSLEMETDMNDIYQLQCNENAVDMYDIFVEDVQESVIVTDESAIDHHVGFFDTDDTNGHHISSPEFSSDGRQVALN